MYSCKPFKGHVFCSTNRFFHKDIHIYGSEAVFSLFHTLKEVLFTFGFKADGSGALLAAIPLLFHVSQSFLSCSSALQGMFPRGLIRYRTALSLALSSGYSFAFRRARPDAHCVLVPNPSSMPEVVSPCSRLWFVTCLLESLPSKGCVHNVCLTLTQVLGGFLPTWLMRCCWCRSLGAGPWSFPPHEGLADPRRSSRPCREGWFTLVVFKAPSVSGRNTHCWQHANPPSPCGDLQQHQ